MADEQNTQVTVRFESTLDSAESNPLLLSGPIELFATVENFDELLSDEMASYVKERLGELSENERKHPHIVVFVNNVHYAGDDFTPNDDSQPHRGAYFNFVGKIDEKISIDSWREILLGTHSHSYPDALEALSSLPYSENNNGKLVQIKDGKFTTVDFTTKSTTQLPELPEAIKNYQNELKRYKDLNEPANSEWNHLDAPLNNLADTYDWLRRDEKGNYKNLAVGNCRQLYHELIKANKKLYLNNDYKITRDSENNIGELLLEAFSVNYDTDKFIPDSENAFIDKTNSKHLILKLSIPFKIYENDEIFLFDGVEGEDDYYLDDSKYAIQSKSENEIVLLLNKSAFNFKDIRKLTILFIRNFNGERMCVVNSGLNLYEVNHELIKLYIEGEFSRKPNLPKYYLSTDAEGEICWDNKLLPSQTFSYETLEINKSYISEDNIKIINGKSYIIIKFNTEYKIDEDFPLLMINNYFAFDLSPNTDYKNITYYIPKDRDIGLSSIEEELEDDKIIKFTLVVIKNSSPGTIADELAKNYVSKKDAVAILSHGKIKLSDYAKASDLSKYALFNHTHSEYALKSHNHDYRYANYYHTHPEFVSLIQKIKEGLNSDEIQAWLDEIKNNNENLFKKLIEALGLHEKDGSYYLDDTNALLSQESINAINTYIEKNYKDDPDLEKRKFTEGKSVKDAICLFAQLFDDDTVKDSQVKLEVPIKSQFTIGGILKGSEFKAGDTIQDVITQMLNPYISKEDALKILTPATILLKWYTKNGGEDEPDEFDNERYYTEINPKHLLKYNIENTTFYFKIEGCKNANGDDCSMDINKFNQKIKQYTDIRIKNDNHKFHPYKINDIDDLENISEIEFVWIVISGGEENKVYDNYGISDPPIILEGDQIIKQKPDFEYGFPAIFVGAMEPVFDDGSGLIAKGNLWYNSNGDVYIENEIYKDLRPDFLDKPLKYTFELKVDDNHFKRLLILLVEQSILTEEGLIVRNVFSGNRIEDFFVQHPANTEDGAVGFSNGNTEMLYIPMVYDVQTEKFSKLKVIIEKLEKVGGEE